MTFKVYSGEIASNSSVDITCFGSFEAESKQAAIDKITFNLKYRYYQKWQIPSPHGWQDREKFLKEWHVECLHDNFRWNLFVCEGEPFHKNVIWKDSNAIISFFERK